MKYVQFDNGKLSPVVKGLLKKISLGMNIQLQLIIPSSGQHLYVAEFQEKSQSKDSRQLLEIRKVEYDL